MSFMDKSNPFALYCQPNLKLERINHTIETGYLLLIATSEDTAQKTVIDFLQSPLGFGVYEVTSTGNPF